MKLLKSDRFFEVQGIKESVHEVVKEWPFFWSLGNEVQESAVNEVIKGWSPVKKNKGLIKDWVNKGLIEESVSQQSLSKQGIKEWPLFWSPVNEVQ
jgi:hypothetical protein